MGSHRGIDAAKSIAVIIAASSRFAAGFFLGIRFPGVDDFDVLLSGIITAAVLVGIVLVAWRRPLGVRPVAAICRILVGLHLVVGVLPFEDVVWVDAVLLCFAAAFGTVVATSMVAFFPARQARRNLIVAFAVPALILPAFHVLADFSDRQIQGVLLATFAIATVAFLAMEKSTATAFPAISRQGGRAGLADLSHAVGRLFSLSNAGSAMLIVSIMFFFGYGVFEEYASSLSVKLSSSDAAMVAVFLLAMALAVANEAGKVQPCISATFVGVWAVWIIGYMLVLILPDFHIALFAAIGVATSIVNLPIWLIVLDEGSRTKTSPLFSYGLVMLLLYVCHTGGRLATIGVESLFGAASFSLTALVAHRGAVRDLRRLCRLPASSVAYGFRRDAGRRRLFRRDGRRRLGGRVRRARAPGGAHRPRARRLAALHPGEDRLLHRGAALRVRAHRENPHPTRLRKARRPRAPGAHLLGRIDGGSRGRCRRARRNRRPRRSRAYGQQSGKGRDEKRIAHQRRSS